MDVTREELYKNMLLTVGPVLIDRGCGCCAYDDTCKFCEGKITYEVDKDNGKDFYLLTHKDTCLWVTQGFGPKEEINPKGFE